VVAVALAGRRWGVAVAGVLGGLPVVAGPILLVEPSCTAAATTLLLRSRLLPAPDPLEQTPASKRQRGDGTSHLSNTKIFYR